jgi:hypothetical protein
LKTARFAVAIKATPPEISSAGLTEDADLRSLVAHWEMLRAARPPYEMPLRAVASAQIGRALKFCHLCDVVDGGLDFRFKIVGIAAFPRIGSQAGNLVSEHPDAGVRLRFPILMRAAMKEKTPIRGTALRETEDGDFQIESIWLPYGESEVRQVLGMVAFRHRLSGAVQERTRETILA